MATRIACLFAFFFLFSQKSFAGSADGRTYTNFGWDLNMPIFPVNGMLNVYRNKSDASPTKTLKSTSVLDQSGRILACNKERTDGWAQCEVDGITGWVKYQDFVTADEYSPVTSWPFRYWLFIASSGAGGEETVLLEQAVPRNPYLIAPAAYSNIFFHALFDKRGRAISPKTHKPTGDRVFLVENAVFLAPDSPKRRKHATWLFLGFYNQELNAMCPGRSRDSCMSAVNLSTDWPGIKQMYQEPPEQYKRNKSDEAWYGAREVAFARHSDPVRPLMYRIPDDVVMQMDSNLIAKAQLAKNREKRTCIADCGKP